MPVMAPFIGSLHHPHQHREAWDYLLRRAPAYPVDEQVQPYRKPRLPEVAKGLHTIQLSRYGHLTAEGGGVVLTACDGPTVTVTLVQLGAGGADQLRRVLFTEKKRGKLQVFAQGTAAEFRQLLDLYGPELQRAGYIIHVLGGLTRIVALRVTKSNRVWWLCDAESCTGVPFEALNRQIRVLGARRATGEPFAQLLHHVIAELQRVLTTRFNVSLHPTIGQSAAKAAAHYIPEGVWLWRPSPTMVAMCRAGGAFRGGYAAAVNYDGPAWKMDVRRQYTAALRAEFPYAVSFGPWGETGRTSRGIFMCTVKGPGKLRVLLNVWSPERQRFQLLKWNGGECVCILPTAEIEGLAALGFLVLPGYGFIFNRTFTFAPFVQRLQELTELHGADSIIGLACKSLGSKVWGKWAQAPTRVELAYAENRPGAEWAPMTKENGDEIEHLWCAERTTYNSMQHIELATIVTAVGRSQLYRKVAQLLDQGHKLAAVYTDAVIVQGAPPKRPPPLDAPIGQWRYEGWAQLVHTRATGAHTWGDVAHRPGVKGATVAQIEQLGSKEAPPEGEAPERAVQLRQLR